MYGDAEVPPPGYTEVLQENHYYPFGMNDLSRTRFGTDGPWRVPQGADGENFYQYNGVESEKDVGFNLNSTFFRNYDPAIGRWSQADPVAVAAPDWSAYRFGFDNPIRYGDGLGLFEQGDPKKKKSVKGEEVDRSRDGREIRISYAESGNPPSPFGFYLGAPGGLLGNYSGNNSSFNIPQIGLQSSKHNAMSPSSSNGGFDWAGANMGIGLTGLGYSALQHTLVFNNRWLGLNGKYYRMGWGGNGWTGGRNTVIKTAGMAKVLGKGLFGTGTLISASEGYYHYSNGNMQGVYKSTADIAFGALATFGGPYGLAVGGVYFLVDYTYGWAPLILDTSSLIEQVSKGAVPGGSVFHDGRGHMGYKGF